jgi:hypothetical protein
MEGLIFFMLLMSILILIHYNQHYIVNQGEVMAEYLKDQYWNKMTYLQL